MIQQRDLHLKIIHQMIIYKIVVLVLQKLMIMIVIVMVMLLLQQHQNMKVMIKNLKKRERLRTGYVVHNHQ